MYILDVYLHDEVEVELDELDVKIIVMIVQNDECEFVVAFLEQLHNMLDDDEVEEVMVVHVENDNIDDETDE